MFCGKVHHSSLIFFVQVGLEQEVSQVIQDIQGQQVTQASQDMGFQETQVQKVKKKKKKAKWETFTFGFSSH